MTTENRPRTVGPRLALIVIFGLPIAVVIGAWKIQRDRLPQSPAVPANDAEVDPVVQPSVEEFDRWGPPSPADDPTANMVLIPAGPFLFGDQQQVLELPAFYIDRYEVSQFEYGQFLRFIQRTCDHSKCHPDEPPGKDHLPLGWGEAQISDPRFPVVGLDFWDVCAYAGWVGKRLPTEQEWEKAARGTDGRRFPWGDDWDPARCNWGQQPGNLRTLLPVDAMPEGRSPFGCHHMLGNAAEWTASFIDKSRGIHCGRGYCWRLSQMVPFEITFRMPGPTLLRDRGSGLRCAMDPPADPPPLAKP